jgi:uncharacterized protein YecE (DUF72 family)
VEFAAGRVAAFWHVPRGMYWIGTSGYDYPEWRGSFYPPELSAAKRLSYYAAQFSTVEINYTFYHLPSDRTLGGWLSQTPDGFHLTLKAPKRITHVARLRGCGDLVATFCALGSTLKGRLGAILFQLPPFLRKDLGALDEFLDALPRGVRATIEFRHESWFDREVFRRLEARDVALCVADSEKLRTPVLATASFAYFRLRDAGYTADALAAWAETIRGVGAGGRDVFVYFKHEEAGKGPDLARTVIRHLERRAA